MGSLYIDFLNQITTVAEESEETTVLVCECSRGELKFDTLSSQTFLAVDNCNIRGICAYVAKNKHLAKINSKHNEKLTALEEKNRKRSLKTQALECSTKSKPKSLLSFID